MMINAKGMPVENPEHTAMYQSGILCLLSPIGWHKPWWLADKTICYSKVGKLPNGKSDRRVIRGSELRHATMLEF